MHPDLPQTIKMWHFEEAANCHKKTSTRPPTLSKEILLLYGQITLVSVRCDITAVAVCMAHWASIPPTHFVPHASNYACRWRTRAALAPAWWVVRADTKTITVVTATGALCTNTDLFGTNAPAVIKLCCFWELWDASCLISLHIRLFWDCTHCWVQEGRSALKSSESQRWSKHPQGLWCFITIR